MRPSYAGAIIASAIAIGLAISNSAAQIPQKELSTVQFSPVLAKIQCEKRGWAYKEVCLRFEAQTNCDPTLAFGCANICVETGLRCVPAGPR